jgi:hypothetical protein
MSNSWILHVQIVSLRSYSRVAVTFTQTKRIGCINWQITPYTEYYWFDIFSNALPFGEDLIKFLSSKLLKVTFDYYRDLEYEE